MKLCCLNNPVKFGSYAGGEPWAYGHSRWWPDVFALVCPMVDVVYRQRINYTAACIWVRGTGACPGPDLVVRDETGLALARELFGYEQPDDPVLVADAIERYVETQLLHPPAV